MAIKSVISDWFLVKQHRTCSTQKHLLQNANIRLEKLIAAHISGGDEASIGGHFSYLFCLQNVYGSMTDDAAQSRF